MTPTAVCWTEGFGYDRIGGIIRKLDNKWISFSIGYAIRLQRVQIEC
jgi:hypothetical protein